MDPILVTGGTGTLGRHVVRRLHDAGCEVRVLTRGTLADETGVRFVTGDLLSGMGIDAAVDGVATIVHCAGSNKGDEVATERLVTAAERVRKPHLVFISVVGAERVPVVSRTDRAMFSYFDMKRKAEIVVANSDLPWTTLRATQFHDLVLTVLKAMTKLPVVPVPSRISFQPIDTDEVAGRLVELALGEPSGLVPDVAGPRVYRTRDLVHGYLEAIHRRRLLVPLRLPGGAARAIQSGANLAPDHAVGTRTWEAFLDEHLHPPALGDDSIPIRNG